MAGRGRLTVLLDEARGSRGGALAIRGQPGVGKTALLADLIGRADGTRGRYTRSPTTSGTG